MSGLSNAQLAAQVSDLLTRWNAREDQVQDWLGGTATGGPEGDGRYPLSNARGDTNLIPCPAALAATASGPAAVALGHRDGAEAAAGVATTQADRSEAQRVLAESAKAASLAARDLTLQYRDRAANAEANAEVHRQYAEAARVGTAADLEATGDHRDAAEYAAAQAENHKVDAAASAAAAGNYNPALYATRADGLSQIAGLQAALDARLLASGFTWAALPGKPSTFTPSAHSHVIADVTGLQAALDGKQAVGSYAAAAHGHAIGDITGLQAALDAKLASSSFTWANLPGKPSTFDPSAHSHVIADVTGLQTALDGKQVAGSYAAATHGHAITDVSGLQAALDAKVASGSAGSLSSLTVGAPGGTTGIIYLGQNQTSPAYLYWNGGSYAMPSGPLLVNGSQVWTAATFDPATKSGVGHGHAMSDITGLSAALTTRDAAIDLKANKASPVFSGDVVIANGNNKVIFHQPNNDAFYLAPSNNAGTDWLWSQQLMYDRPNARWAFNGPLLVQGHAVWTAGNFNPADKANASHSHDWAQVTGRPNWMAGLSYPSAGGEWLRHQNSSGYIDIGPANTGYAHIYTDRPSFYLNKPLFVNNGESVWTSGNFDPASKLGVSAQAASAASAVTSGLLGSNTGAQSGSLQYWNTVGNTTLNPDSDWWYALRMGHGDADTYYSGSLALAFFSDNLRFRRKVNGTNQSWRNVWHDGNFTPASKANLSGATFNGDVWNSAGGSFKVLEANASRANQVYFGADGDGGYIHSTYGSGGTSAFRVICEGTPILKATTAGLEVRGDLDTLNGADRSIRIRSSTSYNYQLIAAGDHFQIREASDPSKVRFAITYPNGNVGMGTTNPLARLHLSYTNPVSVPAAGASGHAFAAGTTGYGLAAGVLTSGNSYIQSTRWDGTATNYPLMLQPNGGATRVGDDLQFDKVRSGMVGVYDAAQTQAIWAMGPSYTLTPGGASNQIGPLYGLAWSYEPNYGGSGNNPQSKTGLYHQLLLMNNGTTLTALGQGIWTAGRIECAGNGGWTMGSYADKNRIDYDGSKFRFLNSGNANAAVEMASLTVNGSINASGELTFAGGNVYTSGGLIYSSNWWRSTGQTGWFNASYSTGIWSIQAGEVRTYNGSKFHSEGDLSSGGVVQSGTEGGFRNAGYVSGRNRIWSFANADAYGLSYYQGAGGWSGLDTINFHFGNTAEGSTLHKFRSDGVAAHAGDLYVKGSRLPVFTSSTGSPSGGVDGDIHITY